MSWHSFVHGLKHDFSKAGHAIENAGGAIGGVVGGILGGVLGGVGDLAGGVEGLLGGGGGGFSNVLTGVMGGITGGFTQMNDDDLSKFESLMNGNGSGEDLSSLYSLFDSMQTGLPKPGN